MARRHILVVDHDPKSLRELSVSLEQLGYRVRTAQDGAEALARLEAATPALLVCAIDVPKLDGYALARRMAARTSWSKIPVIFLTPSDSVEDRIRGLELGVHEYLTKPVFVGELAARIAVLLARRTRQQLARGEVKRVGGSVADVAPIDITNILARNGRTAVLRLFEREARGEIWFTEGEVVDAVLKRLRGEEAVFRALCATDGRFEVEFGEHERPRAIELSTEALLDAALTHAAERRRLEHALPPLLTVMRVDGAELLARMSEIPEELDGVLKLFDGSRTLLSIIDESPFDDLSTMETIVKLHGEGLLRTLAAGAPTFPPSPSEPPTTDPADKSGAEPAPTPPPPRADEETARRTTDRPGVEPPTRPAVPAAMARPRAAPPEEDERPAPQKRGQATPIVGSELRAARDEAIRRAAQLEGGARAEAIARAASDAVRAVPPVPDAAPPPTDRAVEVEAAGATPPPGMMGSASLAGARQAMAQGAAGRLPSPRPPAPPAEEEANFDAAFASAFDPSVSDRPPASGQPSDSRPPEAESKPPHDSVPPHRAEVPRVPPAPPPRAAVTGATGAALGGLGRAETDDDLVSTAMIGAVRAASPEGSAEMSLAALVESEQHARRAEAEAAAAAARQAAEVATQAAAEAAARQAAEAAEAAEAAARAAAEAERAAAEAAAQTAAEAAQRAAAETEGARALTAAGSERSDGASAAAGGAGTP
ncbi:MAG: response regulator transcription factor, partial [Myxococcales bacterium]|nr:response regulator transcription factor [Myxococcales bacterium]